MNKYIDSLFIVLPSNTPQIRIFAASITTNKKFISPLQVIIKRSFIYCTTFSQFINI
ncbi:hypothetical protein ABI_13080 [Asticcacaulis biprosthecium C19]|uniref:Uncharacterized protein n=1 Tax=Asticcacaulis biprosthecium C19 TaxID=715226 RepID=F4QI03_9CAUL|nr:hypothetical protein ABI_13080 [Asticcacaulis biprosthecium C19]